MKDRNGTSYQITDHDFKDDQLLLEAFTHPSSTIYQWGVKRNYQRLELMGDRVLNMVVMDMLFHCYPNANEGELSRRLNSLVNAKVCAEVGKELNVSRFIQANMVSLTTQNGVIADVVEALIGALWVDGGYEAARKFINDNWRDRIRQAETKDPKMALQELAQGRKWELPKYVLVKTTGPEHELSFHIQATVGQYVAHAVGGNKKAAEHAAAMALIDTITQLDAIGW